MPLSLLKNKLNAESESLTWKILIVDDEQDIHLVTQMALKRFELDGRRLVFENAYDSEQAKEKLLADPEIALVFLDVVMETDDAGLRVARWIREELKNNLVRIVLRTGQPGQAPEEEVIKLYDINDYKQKTELDRTKLFTTVITALRAFRDLKKIEESHRYEQMYRNGLELVIQSTARIMETKTIGQFFAGLLSQLTSLIRAEDNGLFVTTNERDVGNNPENVLYSVIAFNGEHQKSDIDPEVRILLDKAYVQKRSIMEDDSFVAYFPSSSNKCSLLYLKGVTELSEVNIQLVNVFASNVGIAFDNLLLNTEIVQTQEELLSRLGNAVESRSKEAGNHIRRIAEFSYILARELNLPESDAEVLKQASPMHDVGKIATPDSILLKPGKLDSDELTLMRLHPQIGYDILKGSDRKILQAAAIISLQHHEKYDGSGYPNALKAEGIHIFARIIAVADVFDALLHKRCYKDSWPLEKVLALINEESGKHFDPQVVAALNNKLDELLIVNSLLSED